MNFFGTTNHGVNKIKITDIAIFIPSLAGGGAERVMVTLANEFVLRGYYVDLVLARAFGPYLENVNDNVRIINLDSSRMVFSFIPLILYLRRARPKVMLSAMTHSNIIAVLARFFSRVCHHTRLILSERSTISLESSISKGVFGHLLFAIVPIAYKFSDKIIVVSKSAALDLIKFGNFPPSLIEVIYNPFDLDKIISKSNEKIVHDWFGSGDAPVIIAIGRLSEQKNFSSLIRAFAKLRKKQHVRLLILGEGEERTKLECLAGDLGLSSNDLQMPGFVMAPFSYLARCAVFVLSSRWEGLPGVLIEAMACGVPVVSTDCPSGPNEILENGRWGVLVPVDDDNALVEAIAKVLKMPRSQLPNVRLRALDFDQRKAVDAYLKTMGLHPFAEDGNPKVALGPGVV